MSIFLRSTASTNQHAEQVLAHRGKFRVRSGVTPFRNVRSAVEPIWRDHFPAFSSSCLHHPALSTSARSQLGSGKRSAAMATGLQLVDQGQLTLDALLADRLADYIVADPRACSISVAHALSHCSGLPNWRNLDHPLRTHFTPGERFSYSGEGFFYLQRVVEAFTGEKLDGLAQWLVFEALGMTGSSFVWERRFEDNRAYGHDAFGTPALGTKPAEANAACSLQT
jgi:CubicO group peptidase (beta-lactamase class C family)